MEAGEIDLSDAITGSIDVTWEIGNVYMAWLLWVDPRGSLSAGTGEEGRGGKGALYFSQLGSVGSVEKKTCTKKKRVLRACPEGCRT